MGSSDVIRVTTEMESLAEDITKISKSAANFLASLVTGDAYRMSDPESVIKNLISKYPDGMREDILIKALVLVSKSGQANSNDSKKKGKRPERRDLFDEF